MVALSSVIFRLTAIDMFSGVFKKASRSLMAIRKVGMIALAGFAGLTIGLTKLVGVAMSFESAFAGVKKTVDLSAEGFAQLEQNFKDITKTTPIAFEELSRIGELAGQMGIEGVDNLTKFTKTIADIVATTDLTAEQAATDFARIANVMQEPIENIDKMGSVVVELGNNFAVTESELVNYTKRLAPAAKVIGFTTAETMGLGAALAASGIRAESGSSAMQRGMIVMQEAVTNGGKALYKLAETSTLTAEEFKLNWEEDAAGTFTEFVEGLAKQGTGAIQTLDDIGLGGVRSTQAFLALAGSGDTLANAFKSANDEMETNTALTDEAAKRYETLESQMTILKNSFKILAERIGKKLVPIVVDKLIPAAEKIIDVIDGLVTKFEEDESFRFFVKTLGIVTLALGAVAIAIWAATSPIILFGLAFIAIVLIITGFIIFVKEALIPLFVMMFTGWKERFLLFWDFLKFIFKTWIGFLKLQWKVITIIFKTALDLLKKAWETVWKGIGNFLIIIWNGIISVVEAGINFVIDGINALIKLINKVPGVNFALIGNVDFSGAKIPMFDDFVITKTGQVLRTSPDDYIFGTKDPSSLMGGSGALTINISGDIYGTDPDQIAEAINNKLREKISI